MAKLGLIPTSVCQWEQRLLYPVRTVKMQAALIFWAPRNLTLCGSQSVASCLPPPCLLPGAVCHNSWLCLHYRFVFI